MDGLACSGSAAVLAQRIITALILVRTLRSERLSGLQCQETTSCLEGQVLLHLTAVPHTAWMRWVGRTNLLTCSWLLLLSFQKGSVCPCISANRGTSDTSDSSSIICFDYMPGFSHPWELGHYFEFVFNLRRLPQHFSRGFRSVNVVLALIQPWQVNLVSFASSRLLLHLKYGPFWPTRHVTCTWDGFRISDVTIVRVLKWGCNKVARDVCP